MQDVTKIGAGDTRRLTAVEFQQLAAVPSAVEWFANLDNPRTRRAYQND
ncbi:integrase, partial [Pseudomonas syringae]